MPFLTTALGIGAIASGIGGAVASGVGASKQAAAAKSAAELQFELGQESLDFQKQVYAQNVERAQPFVNAGTSAVETLQGLLAKPGQGLLTPFNQTFTAPTALTEANDPGFRARLNLGSEALTNSAAARGGLLSTGTARDLDVFAQNFASNEYSNVFSRSLSEFQTAFNVFNANQTNTFNRLASAAGIGQTSTTALGSQGNQAAGNVSYTNATIGGQVGQNLLNQATATASGYTGIANALGGIPSQIGSLQVLQNLLAQNTTGTLPGTVGPYAVANLPQAPAEPGGGNV